jgi:hypothetical protein
MTTNHKASASEWQSIEKCAAVVGSADCSALLELRARVEALEAGATCPHVETSDEGTSYCKLAEQTQDKLDRLIEMDRAAPAQADSLVERVQRAIHDVEFPHGDDEARAAIREMAAWLHEQPGDVRLFNAGLALDKEAER